MFTDVELIRIKAILEVNIDNDKKALAESGKYFSKEVRKIYKRDIKRDQALAAKIGKILEI